MAPKQVRKKEQSLDSDACFNICKKHLYDKHNLEKWPAKNKNAHELEKFMVEAKEFLADIIKASKGQPLKSVLFTGLHKFSGDFKWSRESAFLIKQATIRACRKVRLVKTGDRMLPDMMWLLKKTALSLNLHDQFRKKISKVCQVATDIVLPTVDANSSADAWATPVAAKKRRIHGSPASAASSAALPAKSASPVRRLGTKTPLARALFQSSPATSEAQGSPGTTQKVAIGAACSDPDGRGEVAVMQIAPADTGRNFQYYWNAAVNSICRCDDSGLIEQCEEVVDGENGFLTGKFKDGTVWRSEQPIISRFLSMSSDDMRSLAAQGAKEKAQSKALAKAKAAMAKALKPSGSKDSSETAAQASRKVAGKASGKAAAQASTKAATQASSKAASKSSGKAAAKVLTHDVAEAPTEQETANPEQIYHTMYYASSATRSYHCIAIREKLGKKRQLMQFGSAAKSRQELEDLGERVIQHFKDGEWLSTLKRWAKSEVCK